MIRWIARPVGGLIARYLNGRIHGYEPFAITDPHKLARVLQPADVLLVEGDRRVSIAIKYLTQSTWSHAAIYVGDRLDPSTDPLTARVLVEADLEEGVIAVPLGKYAQLNTRICRAVGLTPETRRKVVDYVVARLGNRYDLKNVVDLARYLLPTPPVPVSWRRRMLALGSGDPTRAICSTLIAQAYQSIRYPILPHIERPETADRKLQSTVKEILHIRHYSLFAPRDFDIAPYFRVIKPTIEHQLRLSGTELGGPGMTTSRTAPAANQPGRSCPLSYRYSPNVFRRAPELRSDTLYVVGGLYGNTLALDRVVHMARTEPGKVDIVFNGDFNWFNIDPASFAKINETVLRHVAVRGNVETELAHDEDTDGCGCAYPEWVGNDVVEWSNEIMHSLLRTARGFPLLRQRLAALPMHLVAEVGGARVAVIHGDAESLAGWSFAHEVLSAIRDDSNLKETFHAANVALFASTHTCLPVVKSLELSDGPGVIVNNGAAGMPNLKGTTFGLITRIATRPAPHVSVFGLQLRGLYVDLLKVDFDQPRWSELFQKNWPPHSPAYLSYFNRIVSGPGFVGPISA